MMWGQKFLLLLSCSVFWTFTIVSAKGVTELPANMDQNVVTKSNISVDQNLVTKSTIDMDQNAVTESTIAMDQNLFTESTTNMDQNIVTEPSTNTSGHLVPKAANNIQYEVCAPPEASYPRFTQVRYSKIKQKINSAVPSLGNRTLNNLITLSLFFNDNLENLKRLTHFVKTSTENFLRELKTIRVLVTLLTTEQYDDGDFPDLFAQLVQMSTFWEDNISILNRLKSEWDIYIDLALEDESGSNIDEAELYELENGLNEEVNIKKAKITDSLRKFQNATMYEVVYLDEKTTDPSTFAWNIITYIKKMLEDNNLWSNWNAVTTAKPKNWSIWGSSNKNKSSTLQLIKFKDQLDLPKEPSCSEIQSVNFNYTKAITNIFFKFNALPIDGLVNNRLFAVQIFFELGLKLLTRFGLVFKNTTNHFLNEFKSTHLSVTENNSDLADIEAQFNQLTSNWEEIVYDHTESSLVSEKNKWDSFLSSSTPMNEQQIKNQTEIAIASINNLLDRFQNGLVEEISYSGEKTTNLSILSGNILIYLGQILHGIS